MRQFFSERTWEHFLFYFKNFFVISLEMMVTFTQNSIFVEGQLIVQYNFVKWNNLLYIVPLRVWGALFCSVRNAHAILCKMYALIVFITLSLCTFCFLVDFNFNFILYLQFIFFTSSILVHYHASFLLLLFFLALRWC